MKLFRFFSCLRLPVWPRRAPPSNRGSAAIWRTTPCGRIGTR
jgi:hypothetical protein